jgi:AmpD protein
MEMRNAAHSFRRPGPRRPALAVNRATHRLRGVEFVPSPNCDRRPKPSDISLLVIHGISLPPGRFGGPWIDRLFTNRMDYGAHPYFEGLRGLRVSAHLCVFRDGRLAQYVPFHRRAWHAGVSLFEGRARCNDFSIGVELEGTDEVPYTAAQYRVLARVAQGLMRAYPRITPGRIVGHSDVAPGRKTDPGPSFDWTRLMYELEYPR